MFLLLTVSLFSSTHPLATHAERSLWQETGRYDEVLSLCERFPRQFPGKVKCMTFGQTPEGRPMVALVASADGMFEPVKLQHKNRPVVYLQGGIHAGEIDGKDAGFWLLRELLENKSHFEILKNVTLIFVPVFNVDGHERFGPNHHVNQNGPNETGWRVTRHNYNLNRDYTKVDAPEMAAMLSFLNRFDPILHVDLHVTDGAKFEHDVAVMVEPSRTGPQPLRDLGLALQKELFAKLEKQNHFPVPFYPSFQEDEKPESGFAYGIAPPRFSHGYWPLRNRFGVLVETHSWRPYSHRVQTTMHVCLGLMQLAAEEGRSWLQAARAADAQARQDTQPLALNWKNVGPPQKLQFRGYRYTKEPSDVSGQTWIRYDDAQPQIWEVPYAAEIAPKLSILPPTGYLIPKPHAEKMAQKLSQHGIEFERLKSNSEVLPGEKFVANQVEFSPTSIEGHQRLNLQGNWKSLNLVAREGSIYVPTQQPKRALVVQLLEPEAPDSFLQWGFFNTFFEPKEYMEPYVAEDVARQLLKQEKVKAAFESRLQHDEAFSKNPQARLDFFYRLHPSYDAEFYVYPIFRVSRKPVSASKPFVQDVH